MTERSIAAPADAQESSPLPGVPPARLRATTWVAAAVLIAAFLSLVWTATAQKSETVDEALFIANGVAQTRSFDTNFDLTHPPLLRWVAGLPAAYIGDSSYLPQPVPLVPRDAMDLYHYRIRDAFQWSVAYFYNRHNNHDSALFWGRFPFALFAVAIGVLLFLEARRWLNGYVAVAGLAAFLFTPEVLAHAEWAHSDLASACLVFALCLMLPRTLEQPSIRNDLWLGLLFGVTIGVKFTALLLLPPLLLALSLWPGRPAQFSRIKWVLLRWACIVVPVYLVMVAIYLPTPRLWPHEFQANDLAHLFHVSPEGSAVNTVAGWLRWLPLPDSFLKGLFYTALLEKHGSMAYFHGALSAKGWWYYFPVALILKYPTPLLLIALAGFVVVWRNTELSLARRIAWTVPPLILFASAMTQTINIGVRSVLFLSPFLALWAAAAVAAARTRVRTTVAVGLIALSVVSGAAAWPNFLTWFNPLFGGTRAASRWLVDSNLDWGQDLPELSRVLRRRNIDAVRLAYFGWAQPEHWGIRVLNANEHAEGWYAVSRTYLSGVLGPRYLWLRDIPPTEYAGGSIALIYVTPEMLKHESAD